MIALLTNHKNQQLSLKFNTQLHLLQDFLREEHAITSTNIQNSIHIRSIQAGFQIEIHNEEIYTFFAYFRMPKIASFSAPLIYGINKNWTIKTAILYFGEPVTKSGKLVEVIYPHLGLGLVFQGNYSNEDSPIDYAYIFKREKSRCGACSIEMPQGSQIFVCDCDCIAFCSSKCKSKYYGVHLIFCELNN